MQHSAAVPGGRRLRMDADGLFDTETVLLLALRPDDAARQHGALIARLCRQGRPPFVVVLTDGDAAVASADRQARDGLAACGLDTGRMVMFGIAGALPAAGPVFDASVAALCFLGWRYDCNLLCAASAALPPARAAAHASGLGLVAFDADGYRLIAPPRRSARDAD